MSFFPLHVLPAPTQADVDQKCGRLAAEGLSPDDVAQVRLMLERLLLETRILSVRVEELKTRCEWLQATQ